MTTYACSHDSMTSDAYAEEKQKGQLSKLAKSQWLELNATLNHVVLAHQYLDIHLFVRLFIHTVSQSINQSDSQSRSLICDLVVKGHICIRLFNYELCINRAKSVGLISKSIFVCVG